MATSTGNHKNSSVTVTLDPPGGHFFRRQWSCPIGSVGFYVTGLSVVPIWNSLHGAASKFSHPQGPGIDVPIVPEIGAG